MLSTMERGAGSSLNTEPKRFEIIGGYSFADESFVMEEISSPLYVQNFRHGVKTKSRHPHLSRTGTRI